MGIILIILGLILIAASIVLGLFYRKNPLVYAPPEISGSAAVQTAYTVRETSHILPTVEDDTATLAQFSDETETLARAGDETETLMQVNDDTVRDLSADYGTETVPLFQAFTTHDQSADDEAQAM